MTIARAQLLEKLEQTYPKLHSLTGNLPDEVLDFRPGPDEWSTREILAHLVDDEMFVMRTRLERMVKEDNPHLVPYDEQKWYQHRNTARDQISKMLSDFAVQRVASLGILAFLREEEWLHPGYQPEYGQFTVEEWLRHWVEHDQVHIHQIETNIRAYEAAG